MFGRKKTSKNPAAASALQQELAEHVHVMPERFYVPLKKNHGGLIIIIAAGVLVVGGLGAAAYYITRSLGSAPPVTTTQPPLPNSNQPLPVVEPLVPVPPQPAALTTTPTSSSSLVIPSVDATSTPPAAGQPLPSGPDLDNDQLTAAEEQLYTTQVANPDSDGDGFSDGNELLNQYNPLVAQQRLFESGLVSRYTKGRYQLIYPRAWQQRDISASGGESEVVFQAGNGEFVEVLTVLNPQRLTLAAWYQDQFTLPLNTLTRLTVNGLEGLVTPDGLTYYLIDPAAPTEMYVVLYNVGGNNQTNFLTTFNTMVKSFTVTP